MEPLRLLGYWRNDQHPEYPDPAALVDATWSEHVRLDVAAYLSHGIVARTYMGYSKCRICADDRNGDRELSDGLYLWPQGLLHYVRDHQVRLPQEFVDHVRDVTGRLEEAPVDPTWWLSKTSE